ncbi:MAG: Uma2 family endonuclease [Gemmataceae bacterium]|nr:Uma2 family endonuclease [Gemmataceae bacterium]
MTTATAELTAADLLRRFGPIPLRRFHFPPYPATVDDVIDLRERENRLFELVDGFLVEKDMGFPSGFVAALILRILGRFVDPRDAGVLNGADGMMELAPDLVRIPDVSFCHWDQFPNRTVPMTPVPRLHPALAVEVLSGGNTTEEMDGKLRDYFASGAALVWLVDPFDRTVLVFSSPDRAAARRLTAADTIDGGTVLPGFSVAVADLFAKLGTP